MTVVLLSDLSARYRRRLLGWVCAVSGVAVIYVSFFPSIGRSMTDMLDGLPPELIDAFGYQQMGTARGWLASTVFGVVGPTLLLGFGISTGAAICAGEEENGTLELELTSPVSRSRLLAARMAALALWVGVLVVVICGTSLAMARLLSMDVPLDAIAAVGGRLLLLATSFTSMSLAIGAVTGRRGFAVGAASTLAALSFMGDALAPSVGWRALTWVSPHAWYGSGEGLLIGFSAANQTPSIALTFACVLAAFGGFCRRDLM